MATRLYIIALLLIVSWAIGYFGYAAGEAIHLLLVLAGVVVSVIFSAGGKQFDQ